MFKNLWRRLTGNTRVDGKRDDADLSNVLFYGNFGLLVEYVNEDKATEYHNVNGKKGSGVARLKQELKLKPTSKQAKAAKEILALYEWYTNVRSNRVNPYTHLIEEKVDVVDLNRAEEIHESYDKEDQEMFMRLSKIRMYLFS